MVQSTDLLIFSCRLGHCNELQKALLHEIRATEKCEECKTARRYDLLDILRPQHSAVTILAIIVIIITVLSKTINTTIFQRTDTRQTLDIVRSICLFLSISTMRRGILKQLMKIIRSLIYAGLARITENSTHPMT